MAVGAVGLFARDDGPLPALFRRHVGADAGHAPLRHPADLRRAAARPGRRAGSCGCWRWCPACCPAASAGCGRCSIASTARCTTTWRAPTSSSTRAERRRDRHGPAFRSAGEGGTRLRRHDARGDRAPGGLRRRARHGAAGDRRHRRGPAVGRAGRRRRAADARAGAVREPGQVREPRRHGDRAGRGLVGQRAGRCRSGVQGRRAADAVRRAGRARRAGRGVGARWACRSQLFIVPEVRLAAVRQAIFDRPMPPRLVRLFARVAGAEPVRRWQAAHVKPVKVDEKRGVEMLPRRSPPPRRANRPSRAGRAGRSAERAAPQPAAPGRRRPPPPAPSQSLRAVQQGARSRS